MRKRVTLFIVDVDDDKILLIHHNRDGNMYYIVPGGGVEEGETAVEAAYREADEETGLTIELGELLWKRPFSTTTHNGTIIEQTEYAYLITQFSGTLCLSGSEFERPSANNSYSLEWMPLAEFPNRVVYPAETDKAKLLEAISKQSR
ncbi:MAG: NUDIX domain-containing protein [Aquificales bacterium]|nr:NUDIX domain-containing protein [Aquificales bacterium]